jgi:hypothetical protein
VSVTTRSWGNNIEVVIDIKRLNDATHLAAAGLFSWTTDPKRVRPNRDCRGSSGLSPDKYQKPTYTCCCGTRLHRWEDSRSQSYGFLDGYGLRYKKGKVRAFPPDPTDIQMRVVDFRTFEADR